VARLRTSVWLNGYGRARERGRLTPTPSRARTQPTAPLTLLLPSWVLPSGGAPVSSRRGTSPRTPPPNTRPLVARLPAADDARTHARAPPAHRPLPLAAARTAAHRVPARTSPHRVCAGVGHRPSSPASTQTLSSVCEHPRRGLPGLAGPSDQPHPAPRGARVVTGFSADHPCPAARAVRRAFQHPGVATRRCSLVGDRRASLRLPVNAMVGQYPTIRS